MRDGNLIVGVAIAPSAQHQIPDDVPRDSVRWGWWAGGLNVRPPAGESEAVAYGAARRIANRKRCPVRIYANWGDGWRQVDEVAEPEDEMCEWWPERDMPASGVAGESCPRVATVSVGKATNWHLCGACAALPRFKRMMHRVWLPAHYAASDGE